MIRDECAFVGCLNCPAEMRAQFDQPWIFLGEFAARGPSRPVYRCRCTDAKIRLFGGRSPRYEADAIVSLSAWQFLTDDMVFVWVYFGVCDRCGRVYWARSGPPFERARACVLADC